MLMNKIVTLILYYINNLLLSLYAIYLTFLKIQIKLMKNRLVYSNFKLLIIRILTNTYKVIKKKN